MIAVQTPYTQFFATDGSPLDNGYLYIGLVSQNPETAPAQVFWDFAGTQPAAQPIRLLNGYPARDGTPTPVFTPEDFSFTVKNARGSIEYTSSFSPSISTSASDVLIQLDNQTNTSLGAALMGWIRSVGSAVGMTVSRKLSEIHSALDFGAVSGGADESVKIQAALTDGVTYFDRANFITNTAITGDVGAFTFGGSFSGTHPLDEGVPSFGTGTMRAIALGNKNAIIGIAINNKPANTAIFPTGLTGYGRVDNSGNAAFGIYGWAELKAASGVATNELSSMNTGPTTPPPGSGIYPNRAFGTTEAHPICLTIGAGGTKDSTVGIHIVREGSAPRQFLNGITLAFDACKEYGIYVSSHPTLASDLLASMVLQNRSNTILKLQHVGAVVADNAVITYFDGTSALKWGLRQDGKQLLPASISQATVGAAGAAAVLPSNPVGYTQVFVGGLEYVQPYYLKS
jgi:hypothetical protein